MDDVFENTIWITRDAEGAYRWTYDIDSSKNTSFLKTYLLIFGLIILIPGLILLFAIYGRNISTGYWRGVSAFLGIFAAVFIGVELLVIAIYKLVEKAKGGTTDISYLMTEDYIVTHPEKERIPQSYLKTDFREVKHIKTDTASDLLLLYEPLRVTHVYVPKEDLPFVQEFISDRIK